METRFELRIFRNRMVLSDRRTGQQLDRKAVQPFSSERLLVADTNTGGELLGAMIKELLAHSRWLHWPKVTIVPMEMCEGGLSLVELMGLKRLGEEAGFNRMVVSEAGYPPFVLK